MGYQIGDFSIISRLSVKTLRYYHECGLLEPAFIDETSGYRYYDQNCLERVKIINKLKELDFPLREIKEILEHCQDDSELISYTIKKSEEIQEKIERYNQIQKKLAVFIQQTRQVGEEKIQLSSEIIIKEIPEMLIASIRFKGKYQDISQAFNNLFKNYGRYCCGAPFSLYYDNDYKEDDAEIEACIPVRTAVENEVVQCRRLPGGKGATVIHKGPYENLGQSYQLLLDYFNENQRQMQIPYREVYLKGPGMILSRSPKKFVTEIQMLLVFKWSTDILPKSVFKSCR